MCVKLQLFTLLLKKRNRAETNRFRCVLRNLMRRVHQTAFKNPDIYRSDANRKTFESRLTDLRAFLYSVRPFDKFGIRVVHELQLIFGIFSTFTSDSRGSLPPNAEFELLQDGSKETGELTVQVQVLFKCAVLWKSWCMPNSTVRHKITERVMRFVYSYIVCVPISIKP